MIFFASGCRPCADNFVTIVMPGARLWQADARLLSGGLRVRLRLCFTQVGEDRAHGSGPGCSGKGKAHGRAQGRHDVAQAFDPFLGLCMSREFGSKKSLVGSIVALTVKRPSGASRMS